MFGGTTFNPLVTAGTDTGTITYSGDDVLLSFIAGPPPACTTISGAFTNAAGHSIPCILVPNLTFTGNVSNAGTITGLGTSGGGITVTNSTITGAIVNSGILNGGIKIDAQSIIDPVSVAILITGPTFSGGISNAGVLQGTQSAIRIAGTTTFGGGITNSGTLSGALYGLQINGVSTFAGGVTNASGGLITTAGTGIALVHVTTFLNGITNNGTIAAGEVGILLDDVTTFSGNISNAGTITAATGLKITASTINGSIVESGLLLASNVGITIDSASKLVSTKTAIAITGPTFTGGVSNAGLITAANAGIDVSSVSSFFGGITNSGTVSGHTGIEVTGVSTFGGGIVNNGRIAASASCAIAVSGVSNFSGGISNGGTITAPGLYGVYVSNVSTFAANISNSGTISAKTGIGIFGSTISSEIRDTGVILGTSHGILIGNNSLLQGSLRHFRGRPDLHRRHQQCRHDRGRYGWHLCRRLHLWPQLCHELQRRHRQFRHDLGGQRSGYRCQPRSDVLRHDLQFRHHHRRDRHFHRLKHHPRLDRRQRAPAGVECRHHDRQRQQDRVHRDGDQGQRPDIYRRHQQCRRDFGRGVRNLMSTRSPLSPAVSAVRA